MNEELQQQVKLFKQAMIAVGTILEIPPIKITQVQYTKTCKEHGIKHISPYKLQEVGGFVYLRDGLFKHLRKQVRKAKQEKGMRNIILQQFADYIKEKHVVPTIKDFKKFCTAPVGEFYKDINTLLEEAKEKFPEIEEETLNESVYTQEYSAIVDEALESHNRFVITTAVAGKQVDIDFYKSLKNYATANNAAVLILPCQDTASRRCAHKWTLDPELRKLGYVLFGSKKINENLTIWNIKTSAKQIKPTVGLNRMVQPLDSSIIIASPKQYLEYIPTTPDRLPHAIMTTGAVTVNDYTSDFYMSHRTSKIAEIDHKVGAVVVERVDEKKFHFRHVEASADKTFTDMGVEYFPDGTQKKLHNSIMVLGDAHSSLDMDVLYDSMYRCMSKLDVKEVILHDVFNASSVSPHEVGKIAIQSAKAIKGISSIEQEGYLLKQYLEKLCNKVDKVVISKGNHDMHLDKYLTEGRFMYSPEDFYLGCALAMKVVEGEDPLKYLMETWIGLDVDNVKWLALDESYKVHDIELGQHGALGANGARGNKNTFDACLGKCIVGHSHTAGIMREVYTVGVACNRNQGYNKGFSSWTYTSCVLYENGTRQLINFIPNMKGEFLYE